MDETIKIYQPGTVSKTVVDELKEEVKKNKPKRPSTSHVKKSKWKFFCDEAIWKEILSEETKKRKELNQKYPWFEIVYNWKLVICVFALFISFIIWGVNIHTERTAVAYATAAVAEKEAEYQARQNALLQEEKQKQLSEENVMGRMATLAAKACYGIRNFEEKYGYSERDFKTYVRCMCNRVDYAIALMSDAEREAVTLDYTELLFKAVVEQEGQFLAYSEKNPALNTYYKWAFEEINDWRHESAKPWDISFRFAELNDDGIWLVQNPNSNGYARRVRY